MSDEFDSYDTSDASADTSDYDSDDSFDDSADIPDNVSEDVPSDDATDFSDDVPDSIEEDSFDDLSLEDSSDVPESIEENCSDDLSSEDASDVPESIEEDLSDDFSSEDVSDVPDEIGEDIPADGFDESGEEIVDEIPADDGIVGGEEIAAEAADETGETDLSAPVETEEKPGMMFKEINGLTQEEAKGKFGEYYGRHNYGREDYDTYSQDPEWRNLMRKAYPEIELPELSLSQEEAKTRIPEYYGRHNYGREDYDTYSQDPEWRDLMQKAYPETELPPLSTSAGETPASGSDYGDIGASSPDGGARAGTLKSLGVAAYMNAALKADDAGYRTVHGYMEGVGADLGVKVVGKMGQLPPDVTRDLGDVANSAARLHDEIYAAQHPGEVLDFGPTPVPQELIDKNTLVLDGNPYAGTPETPDFSDVQAQRRIVGTPGVVTGGDSTKLGKNMLEDMGVPRDVKWGASGYQAHHVIPKEFASHPVIQKIGMDVDDASNGIFLRTPNDGVNAKSVHYGYHEEYSNAVSDYLDSLDPNESVEVLERKVADLQSSLKRSLEDGVPLYMKKENVTTGPATYRNKGGGATQEMWEESIRKNLDKK